MLTPERKEANNCILGPVYRFAGKNEKVKEETMWTEVKAGTHVLFFFKINEIRLTGAPEVSFPFLSITQAIAQS